MFACHTTEADRELLDFFHEYSQDWRRVVRTVDEGTRMETLEVARE